MTDRVRIAAPVIGDAEKAAVNRVLDSGMMIQGPEVAAFESEFARLVDGRASAAVNSGTSAVHLALVSQQLEKGTEVIVPSFTFAATANAVCLAGLVPRFVDIEPLTYCVSPDAIESSISGRTSAIMPVHLYGHPADMPAIAGVAAKHGLAVIEDAAQAHGAVIDETPVGAWGDAGAFSFYPTKNMTTGEGGMVTTRSSTADRLVQLLRNQGMARQYEHEVVGMNLRMTDIAAAIGRVQLSRLEEFTRVRQRNAAILNAALETSPIVGPTTAANAVHVFNQFTVRCQDRDALIEHLDRAGVDARVYYPTPVHELAPFRVDADLPETRRAAAEVVSLPVGPHLTDSDLARVAEALDSFS